MAEAAKAGDLVVTEQGQPVAVLLAIDAQSPLNPLCPRCEASVRSKRRRLCRKRRVKTRRTS